MAAAAAALLLLAGCAAPAGPPEVHWGLDECNHCHMILSEARYAAVARGPAGEEARFDDLGCLAAWRVEQRGAGWRVWVHAARGDAWLDAEQSWFAPAGAPSPMGSGLLAFASREAAAAATVQGSSPLPWRDLLALYATPGEGRGRVPAPAGSSPT